MCYVVAVKRACGCFPEFLPNVRADDVCKITKIPCIIQVKQDMQSWLFDDYCECPRDCVSRKYRAEITVGNFKALKEVLKNPYVGLNFNDSTSSMSFFFTNPVYVKQKQETVMSIISLVSNLGGVFGLLMGCSCISMLELLFFIYIRFKTSIKARVQRWMHDTVSTNG